MSIVVRAGRPADIATVGDLWEQMLAYHIERDRRYLTADGAREAFLHYVRVRVLRSADNKLLIAEVDKAPAGFLIARIERGGPVFLHPDFGYITDTCVDEDYRREGVGRALFEAAKSWFRAKGVTNIRVSVASENPGSMTFWRDLGFRPFMERLWYDLDG
jgi:ribosomal protein S18 acetylase RimI-like enzyme